LGGACVARAGGAHTIYATGVFQESSGPV